MKFKSAKDYLRASGVTITRRDGEFRVNLSGSHEGTAYYTTDLGDAVRTGDDMAFRRFVLADAARQLVFA